MSTPPTPAYTMMQEREDDYQKWFDLATDSEAEEAQKSYFFDNLNWESVSHIVDDSSPSSPFEIGNSECKSFMSQSIRSPELGPRRIEAKGCPADTKTYAHETSERTHDYENLLPNHGQPSCSYDVRDGHKDQSRASYAPVELYSNERGMSSMSPAPQLGTDNSSTGQTIYLSVRRRQPSGQSPIRSSAQETSGDEDFRQEMNEAWEGCRCFDRDSSSCLASARKDKDDELLGGGRKWMNRERGDNQVIDEPTPKELSITRDSPKVERQSSLSSMNDRKLMCPTTVGGPISGCEGQLKEMTTQQKRKIMINTSSSRPRSTSSSNSIGGGSALYRSSSRAMHVEAQTNGQRKACDDESNENHHSNAGCFRKFKEDGNEQYKLPPAQTEQESQKPLQVNTEFDQASLTFDSRFLKGLTEISGAAYNDHDEREAQFSMAFDLAESPSPTENVELKRKVEELETLVADERKKFQVLTERLAEQQVEADKNAQQMQDDWDGKIRELQEEKFALSIRLQSTETAHLASLLAGRGSQARPSQSAIHSAQSAVQPAQSLMQATNGSAPQRRISSHRHHEEFLKELEADQVREKSGSASIVSDQEAKKLKQEILQQEVLIRGYQHENEKAMQKIKEVQAEAKEKARIMAEENASLANQLVHCQRRGMTNGPQATTELSLQEALDREAQLKMLEAQLKKEIARLKDELIKAHAELERREKRVSKTLDDLESERESLKNSLTEERESHARTTLAKEDTVKSFVENQQLLSSLQSTIDQQVAQILELSSKVAHYEGDVGNLVKIVEEDRVTPSKDKRSASVDDRSSRRMQPSLKQVRKPEAVHRGMKPGLSALAQVSKDESDKVRRLQMEVAALRKQNHSKEDESNKSLNMLKHEFEKSKQEYEKRLQHLQATHPNMETGLGNEQVAQSRVKALETQVVNIRIHYARKLKELTDKLAESKIEQSKLKVAADNAAQLKKISPNRTVKVKELKDAKERIGMLEDVLDRREHTIKSLQQKLGLCQPEGKAPGDDSSAANSITAKQVASLSKIKSKIQGTSPQRGRPIQPSHKVHDSEEFSQASPKASKGLLHSHEAQDELKDQKIKELKRLNSVTPPTEEKRDDSPHESEPDIVSLRKRLERTEVSREALQQQCLEAMEKVARCSITHQKSLYHLQQASNLNAEIMSESTTHERKGVSGAVDWRSYNDPLERENRTLQARLKGLSEELEEAQAQVRKPMQVQSFTGCHRNTHNHTMAKAREEINRKGHLFSEENPRKGNRWWQFS